MPFPLKTALRLVALTGAGAASVLVAGLAADWVEARNRSELRAALDGGGYGWAGVTTDGLLARLSGTAPDEAARFGALSLAGNVVNPVQLRDEMTVADAAPADLPAFRLEILRARDRVTLLGLLPAGVAPAGGLGTRIAALVPGVDVSDLTAPGSEPAPPGWPAAIDPVLAAIAALKDARLVLTPGSLTVAGLAPDRETGRTLSEALAEGLGPDVAVEVTLEPPRPVLSPFVLRLRSDAAGLQFEACVASSEEGRERILAAARAAGMAALPDCPLAFGAPGPEWESVAEAAVAALAAMGPGAVTLSDLTVTLAPAAEADAASVSAAASTIAAALPPAYGLKLVQPVTEGAGAAGIPPPVFTARRAIGEAPVFDGPVGDAGPVVETFARARFPGAPADLKLEGRSAVPDGWSLRVLAGLDALAMLEGGTLTVTPDLVSVTGTSGDPQAPSRVAAALTAALGEAAPIHVDIAYDARLDPASALPTPEACLSQVRAIQVAAKITFQPGSTELDDAALKIVRRIALVLRGCGGTGIEISGHTDSQGRDEMNRALSQARAEAVMAALVAERVPAASLSAVGHGEDRPISDNGSAAGREANRRIEFSLREPLQGPPAPALVPAAAQREETRHGSD